MKRILLGLSITLLLCSCNTFRTSTVTTKNVESALNSSTTAELNVSPQKISYTYYPKKLDRKAGLNHIVQNATAGALKEYGNADVLVERQYETVFKNKLFGKKIKYVIITGYPATYENFRVE